jgi:hypothetical protein
MYIRGITVRQSGRVLQDIKVATESEIGLYRKVSGCISSGSGSNGLQQP